MSVRASLAALVLLAAACTAGNGPAVPVATENREPPPDTNEPGAQGPDPGSGEYESPGGPSTGVCPACDTEYSCTRTVGLNTQTSSLPLITGTASNGETACLFAGSSAEIFDCSGVVEILAVPEPPSGGNSGVSAGGSSSVLESFPWTSSGDDGFSFDFGGGVVVCVPQGPVTPIAPVNDGSEDAG